MLFRDNYNTKCNAQTYPLSTYKTFQSEDIVHFI